MQLDLSGTSVGEKCTDFYVLGDKLYTVTFGIWSNMDEGEENVRMTPNFCACVGRQIVAEKSAHIFFPWF